MSLMDGPDGPLNRLGATGPPGDTPSAPCGTWPPSSALVLTPVDPNDLELGMGNQFGGFTTQQVGWTKEYGNIIEYSRIGFSQPTIWFNMILALNRLTIKHWDFMGY